MRISGHKVSLTAQIGIVIVVINLLVAAVRAAGSRPSIR